MAGQRRDFFGEGFGRPAEHSGFYSQLESIICPAQTLQQPTAKESCSTGNKNPLSAQFLPHLTGVFKNEIQVVSQRMSQALTP